MKKAMVILVIALIYMLLPVASHAEWLTFNGGAPNEPPVCQLVSNNGDCLVYEFTLKSLQINPWPYNPTYCELSIPDLPTSSNSEFLYFEKPTQPAGFPELPQLKMLLALPTRGTELQITTDSAFSDLECLPDYLVRPIFSYLPGMNGEFCLNDSLYATGDFYPASIVSYTLDQWRDLPMSIITFTPVQFIPPYLSGPPVIAIRKHFQVTIKFSGQTNDSQMQIPDLGYFGGIGNSLIANYNRAFTPPTSRSGSWAWTQGIPTLCDYLIVAGNQVSSTPQDSAKIEELASHRADLNGFNVRIIRLANIPNSSNWQGIKSYLTNVYYANTSMISSDGHLVYVLLLGDAWEDDGPGPPIIIPTTPIIPRTEAVSPEELGFGGDHYYANIDSTGAGYFEDIAIGRLSVGNSTELAYAIEKIIRYETMPVAPEYQGWKQNVSIQAGPMINIDNQGIWYWSSSMESEQQNLVSQLSSVFELQANNGPYNSYLAEAYHFGTGPTVYTDDRFHTDYDVYAPEDSAYTRDNWLYPNFNGQYSGTINNTKGMGQYYYIGHGCRDALAFQMHVPKRPYLPGPWPVYGLEGTVDDIQNADRLSFSFYCACLTGNFDYDSSEWSMGYMGGDVRHDSFTEQQTVKSDRGDIAVVGAVKPTYLSTSNVQFHFSRLLTGAIVGYAEPFMEGAVGANLMMAKNMAGSMAASHYQLFGDPAVNLLIVPQGNNVMVNTTWQGRVDVINSIIVANGVTLTLQPGTDVILHNGACLQVNGKIIAEGSAGLIKFRGGTAPGYGLILNHLTSPLSRITNCQFERLEYGVKIDSVNLESAIASCEFTDCDYGIYATHTHTQLEYNSFDNCGIGLYAEQYNGTAWSDGRIKGNNFTNCDSLALAVMGGSFLYIEYNEVEPAANTTGIWCFDCDMLRFNRNEIKGGQVGALLQNCDSPMMSENEIDSTFWSALDLVDTSPYMDHNVLQAGTYHGMRLYEGSVPMMSSAAYRPGPYDDNGSGGGQTIEQWGVNTIKNCGSIEIWTDGALPNIYNGHNNIYDLYGPPTTPLIQSLVEDGQYHGSVRNNYWGPGMTDTVEVRARIFPPNNPRFVVWVEAVDTVENGLNNGLQPFYYGWLNWSIGDGYQPPTITELQSLVADQEAVINNPATSLSDSILAVIKAGSAYLSCWINQSQIGRVTDLPLLGTMSSLRPKSPNAYLATVQAGLNYLSGITSELPVANSNLPEQFALYQNYPNPFNPTTTIRFDLPEASRIKLEIYDLLGRKVITLADRPEVAGRHLLNWHTEASLASGVYFYRLEARSINSSQSYSRVQKMVLLK